MHCPSIVPFCGWSRGLYGWEYCGWSVSGDCFYPLHDCYCSDGNVNVLMLFCSLGSTYEAANFRMSTWTPMIWGGINTMVLTLASFPIQGGL